ncbi:DUF4168 domain-containing protein [Marinilabilia salmonicolor]|jgi:hypothetical protein|uniref:Uncharacterized protein DUF4168 n=1 Tax=Marinilabilia salmonicolor TaxID=989 RepID=A0A2T0XTC1_9BACT|nr:DUF4168 domain-containing protein [Marinilabilia salmonicolor]PRZ02136.1 uncharacterized protein DUF4168 [Marinilabilia salmonicolor]RCW36091.1 uncharacterized protein DUF4168 [Marinilabilia salmonicolor]
MSFKKQFVSLFLTGFFLIGGTAAAQNQMMQEQGKQLQKSYSDEEVDLFADVVVKVVPVQQEAEQKMVKKIEEGGMKLDNFNKIARNMQQGQQPEGLEDADMEKFQSISQQLQAIQMETQKKMNEIISNAGISPALYQEMITAYSTNPDVKKKVDEKLAEQQQQ